MSYHTTSVRRQAEIVEAARRAGKPLADYLRDEAKARLWQLGVGPDDPICRLFNSSLDWQRMAWEMELRVRYAQG